MTYNYEEQIAKQDEFLRTAFRGMTDKQLKEINLRVNEMVENGTLDDEDFESIRSVVVWKSLNGFYALETHPREELWKLLVEICS